MITVLNFYALASFYLLMVLQPGLARISAMRKDVIQQGTKVSDVRDDADSPTMRHRAQVAASESYMRVLPPSFWMKRNEGELRKILTEGTYEETAKAAESAERSTERHIKDVKEKVWEEKVQGKADQKGAAAAAGVEGGKKKKKSANNQSDTSTEAVAAAA